MRINNNIMAMNAHRQLGVNSRAQGKSIEKLSSGLRINRAGDDAAGLAISEKMRSQVRGLGKASRNAQDDISLIQTTEGALNETHAIIHRMREMAVQSANDSNTDADREALQAEMDQLAQEVTRIANDTEFNTRKVLNGNLDKNTDKATGDITFHIGANKDQNMKFGVQAMDAFSLGLTEDKYSGAAADATGFTNAEVSRVERGVGLEALAKEDKLANRELTIATTAGATGVNATSNTVEIGQLADGTAVSASINMGTTGEKYNDITVKFSKGAAGDPTATFDATKKEITISLSSTAANNTADKVNTALQGMTSKGYDFASTGITFSADEIDISKPMTGKQLVTKEGTDSKFNVKVSGATAGGTAYSETIEVKEGDRKVSFQDKFKGLSFEIQKDTAKIDATLAGKVKLSLDKSSEASFNVDHSVDNEAKVAYGINILSQGSANEAIERIDSALKKVSDVRAGLGAVQNRLEHTIKNVDTAAENLQASESRIRDVDMAKEMMNYTKNNILNQAAQSMLAQANQLPQGVLQLLR